MDGSRSCLHHVVTDLIFYFLPLLLPWACVAVFKFIKRSATSHLIGITYVAIAAANSVANSIANSAANGVTNSTVINEHRLTLLSPRLLRGQSWNF